jgi:Lar family restriction alleviation protein
MKLNPCPFCGSTSVAVVSDAVRCGCCAAVGPYAPTKDQAILRWNQRATYSREQDTDRTGEEQGNDTVSLDGGD